MIVTSKSYSNLEAHKLSASHIHSLMPCGGLNEKISSTVWGIESLGAQLLVLFWGCLHDAAL